MSNEFKAYNYYEFCEGQEKSAADWCIAPSNPSGNSSPNKILMLSTGEDEPFGIIAELGEEAKITNNKVSTVTAIIPEKITDTWRSDLVGLWTKLTKEDDKSVEEVRKALEEAGYKIEKNYAFNKRLPIISPDSFKYNTWEDVAKAAVKNEKDWWKLVPKEGMGKFIGVGALAGLAVAGAGIGLYEALKPKSKSFQPSPLNRQG